MWALKQNPEKTSGSGLGVYDERNFNEITPGIQVHCRQGIDRQ
jgi:hypothetical protein